ncbi:hypothetical protein RFI_08603 [Reticulomyxa filosa]|uniref:Tubulin beta chain n=1 Tax=Reticulomyxa filosa TaxID=46433 RepID=X6NT93_RETFI|nr:hypothetical protein RFI_08603 [Reticulomyxa filosa]|eukprot:ETO28527.1 hypothetical protein RFI_08603 [Reticulomyxa filosa]
MLLVSQYIHHAWNIQFNFYGIDEVFNDLSKKFLFSNTIKLNCSAFFHDCDKANKTLILSSFRFKIRKDKMWWKHFCQCGNQIGDVFWKMICKEHHLLEDGTFVASASKHNDEILLKKIGVYFKESESRAQQYVPRSVLIDTDSGTLDLIRTSPTGRMFKPDICIYGNTGTNNNWAKGYYTEGEQLIEECVEVVRKEAESCDSLQGFQLTQSLGGGTGSGLGALLQKKIKENFADRMVVNYSVYPSPKVSDVVVEPYNAILSIAEIINNDGCFVLDNEALYNIAYNVLKQSKPKYKELNWVISLMMAGATSLLR